MALTIKVRMLSCRSRSDVRSVRTPVATVPQRFLRASAVGPESIEPLTSSGVETAAYIGLGATLATFVITFGVIPQFKSSFKEPDSWLDIYAGLEEMGGVPAVPPAEAQSRADRGAVLMDVRMARRFAQGSMRGSVNFPLYQPISGWGLVATIRRAGFASFGVYGTERNPEWLAQIEEAIPDKRQEIIAACERGGSMQKQPGMDTGFQSQSLKAAYYLKKAGYTNVSHVEGGVDEYRREVAPLEVEDAAAAQEPTPVPA